MPIVSGREVDAVVVGAGTIRSDDPDLTRPSTLERRDVQPRPVIIAGGETAARRRADLERRTRWSICHQGIATSPRETWWSWPGTDDHPDPQSRRRRPWPKRGLLDVLLEGGPSAGRRLVAGRVVIDRGVLYLAGKIGAEPGSGRWRATFSTVDRGQRGEYRGGA